MAGIAGVNPETHVGEPMGERSAHIGEGLFGPARSGITPRGGLFHVGTVDPGDSGGHHAELEMVGDGIGVARLRLCATYLLLDFSESGFDFPASAIDLICSTDRVRSVVTSAIHWVRR